MKKKTLEQPKKWASRIMMSTKKPLLIVVAGPTAIGKTALAIEIAKHYQTEIISADSRQFFKEISIGTAKPSVEELEAVPHHFIGHLSVSQPYNVGLYEQDALQLMDHLFQKHQQLVLVGGSGLYINAICNGIDHLPEANWELREELHQLHQQKGIVYLQEELKQRDPVYYQQVDTQNPQRLMRALEVCITSGQPYSSFRQEMAKNRPFDMLKICLDMNREELYNRINNRVDLMVAQGLVAEVESVVHIKHLNALHTVGYTEIFNYLNGQISLEEAIAQIKQNTRRYAKRQLTWFRRETDYTWFEPTDWPAIQAYIEQRL